MSRWTDGLPPYEALLERCVGLCRDEMFGEDYLGKGMRAALAEVLRTLKKEVAAGPSDMSHAAEQAKAFIREWLSESPLEPPQ